jgi:glycosyltransferase involved in cell wall biosynthesis
VSIATAEDLHTARRRRVLLVSQRPVDYGGGGSMRWRYLSGALRDLGWDVITITSRANLTANEASTDPGLASLAAGRARVMNAVGAAVRPLSRRVGLQPEALAPNLVWSLTGRPAIRRAIAREHPNVVWATAPPQSAIFAAGAVARRAGIPMVAELRDLWAGNPYFDARGRLLTRLEAGALNVADAVVTVTPGCRETLLRLHPELGSKLRLLPNGFDPSLLELRDSGPRRSRGRATLIHAGALYADRSAAALVRALDQHNLRERVRLELVGAVDPATKRAVRAAQVEVVLHPPVGWRQAIDRVHAADFSVVINSPLTGGAMALPSKLYEALALGRPVLALTPAGSDTDRLLRSLDQAAGIAPPDDEKAIAAAVERLLADPPTPVPPELVSEYNRETVARRIAALLARLAGT